MSDQSVVVKTRKFMKNPLLSRRQVRQRLILLCDVVVLVGHLFAIIYIMMFRARSDEVILSPSERYMQIAKKGPVL